jgi:AbrB family looped-hinge helix DNA binding protein
MTKLVTVNERGALTLPKEVRDKLGVARGGSLLVDVAEGGVVTLRAGVVIPVEVYSEERLREFEEMNELPLAGKKLRWRKAR